MGQAMRNAGHLQGNAGHLQGGPPSKRDRGKGPARPGRGPQGRATKPGLQQQRAATAHTTTPTARRGQPR
eukprot:13842373-Alexandrium_andersonii.AAC.1